MAEADRRTIEELGIPGRTLMETAGRRIAESLIALGREPVLLLCGRGGNGGDGLVALRMLAANHMIARAIVLAPRARLTRNTRATCRAAERFPCGVRIVPDEAAWEEMLETRGFRIRRWERPAVVVDAMLGTGARGPLRGLYERVVMDLNRWLAGSPTLRVAVDVPTGLSSDTGAVPSLCFRADRTIALAAPKICHAVHPAREACGVVEVAEIGIPEHFLESGPAGVGFIRSHIGMRRDLAPRSAGAHKGDLGRLVIVAGSKEMPGAAALAAQGALGAGVGLLTVAGPTAALAGLPPEAMRLPLPDNASAWAASLLEKVTDLRADALVVGPGLGAAPETASAVRELVRRTSAPLVLDADGLNAFARRAGELAERRDLALTPHAGEAARLLGRAAARVAAERLEFVRGLVEQTANAVLLKGPGTLVNAPGEKVMVNPTGGPELASGGTGDILAGVAGAFLARGLKPFEALATGAFLHGRAGELARERYGEDGVSASDVARFLGRAIRWMHEEGAA